MRNIFIVTALADLTGVTTLEGALAAIGTNELLAVGDGANYTVGSFTPGVSSVQFFTRLANGELRCSVPINRRSITRINRQDAVAGQKYIGQIGATSIGNGLVIPSTGEGNITLRNNSYNHAIPTQRVNISVTKKATETASAYLDRVVAEINAAMALQPFAFVTAAKLGTINMALQFTVNDPFVDFSVQFDGIFAGYTLTETQALIIPVGRGKDIKALELELTKHLGNHGYAEMNENWYKGELQTDDTVAYDVSTLDWKGIGETPTSSMHVANNTLQFATPTGGNISTIHALLVSAFATTDAVLDEDIDATDGASDEA